MSQEIQKRRSTPSENAGKLLGNLTIALFISFWTFIVFGVESANVEVHSAFSWISGVMIGYGLSMLIVNWLAYEKRSFLFLRIHRFQVTFLLAAMISLFSILMYMIFVDTNSISLDKMNSVWLISNLVLMGVITIISMIYSSVTRKARSTNDISKGSEKPTKLKNNGHSNTSETMSTYNWNEGEDYD